MIVVEMLAFWSILVLRGRTQENVTPAAFERREPLRNSASDLSYESFWEMGAGFPVARVTAAPWSGRADFCDNSLCHAQIA